MTSIQQQVQDAFQPQFGKQPVFVVRAPGRVNLIGEHTDYNDGFVMPLATEGAIYLAVAPADGPRVRVYSVDFGEQCEFSLDGHLEKGEGWIEYMKGVAVVLAEAGYRLSGFDAVLGGDVPMGAGLSSSAALEMATARALANLSGLAWDAPAMAKLGQKAENTWVGVNCGIMDQMISAAGHADMALLIDCRSLDLTPVPLPSGAAVVILDTNTRRGLVDSAYNERRSQCEAAAQFFGVPALRDVSIDQFEMRADQLDEVTRRRARHVITENDRTLQAAEAMKAGDAVELGRLMDASHESLRYDFEVCNDGLNEMVRCAREEDACFGARMTGAGFGGCAVALVREAGAASFADEVSRKYREASDLEPKVYVTRATDGAAVVVGENR
jgi:galactokinase